MATTAAWGATPLGLLRPAPARPPAASQQCNTLERASAAVARLKLGQVPEPLSGRVGDLLAQVRDSKSFW
jgi:hypothetical protein